MDGSPAGFSGATFADCRLWVAASVENTTDLVLDGEVLGSFVGVLDLAAGTAEFARLAWADGRAYRGKVEGLALRPRRPGTPQDCSSSPTTTRAAVRPWWLRSNAVRGPKRGSWLWLVVRQQGYGLISVNTALF